MNHSFQTALQTFDDIFLSYLIEHVVKRSKDYENLEM